MDFFVNFNKFSYNYDIKSDYTIHDLRGGRFSSTPIVVSCDLSQLISIELKNKKTGRMKKYECSVIEQYCIDRILRINKAYDPNLYTVSIIHGYYGEELGSVLFEHEDKVVSSIQCMLMLKSDIEKIKYVLMEEYSYLLPEITKCTKVTIEQIDIASMMKNNDYLFRLKKNEKDSYIFAKPADGQNIPIGIVYKDKDYVRLIDGYHRFLSTGMNSPRLYITVQL